MQIRPVTIGFALEQKLYIFFYTQDDAYMIFTQDEDNHDV